MNFVWQNLETASASRVAKAREAAYRAVTICDAARDDAIREAGLVVVAGDDVARRDEAALAARDAAVRCVDASLAALEVAARCDAVAEEVPANLRGDATFAAEQARAAAARCNVEGGAPAASRAANAFSESCLAACVDAKALASAAKEAAARCVGARKDSRTASLVFHETASLLDRYNPFCKAHRESFDGHKEARKDAVAAMLAARKAALRCVEASRRAVSAASVARKTASRCVSARVDGAAVAAAEAREAADRCVAPRVDKAPAAAKEAVMLADDAAGGADAPQAAVREVVAPADESAGGANAPQAAAREVMPPAGEAAGGVVAVASEVVPPIDEVVVGAVVSQAATRESVPPAVATADANPSDAAAHTAPVVPLADAAAFEARKAAARCDAALADPVADAAKDSLEKIRGWLMTVAALFVGIAFQAILRPPTGMTFEHCPKSPGWSGACIYWFFNMVTMAAALTMLVLLMTMRKISYGWTLAYMISMLAGLTISVAAAFTIATSSDKGIQQITGFSLLIFAIMFSIGPIVNGLFS